MVGKKTQLRPNRGKQARKGNIRGMYRFGYELGKVGINLVSRPQWGGLQNLPESGPFIVAPNHISNVDPPLMGYFLADNGIEIRFLAKESLFRVPVVGPFLRWWGMIPVVRDSAEAGDSLKYARAALDEGDVVGIYFEGTLTRDPAFWPMKGKTGLARLALDTRVPVVPIIQWGAQDVMDRYAPFIPKLHRPKLLINVLPPIDYSDIEGDSSNWEGVRELTRRLQNALEEGAATMRAEEAPATPWNMRAEDGPAKPQLKKLSRWRRNLAKVNRVQDVLPANPQIRN